MLLKESAKQVEMVQLREPEHNPMLASILALPHNSSQVTRQFMHILGEVRSGVQESALCQPIRLHKAHGRSHALERHILHQVTCPVQFGVRIIDQRAC